MLIWGLGIAGFVRGVVMFRQGMAYDAADAFGGTVMPLLAAVILANKPRHVIGWLLALVGLSALFGILSYAYVAQAVASHQPESRFLSLMVRVLVSAYTPETFVGLPYVLLLAPNGRLVSSRWRWALVPPLLGMVASTIADQLWAWPLTAAQIYYSQGGAEPTSGLPATLFTIALICFFLSYGSGLIAIVTRFHQSKGAERQQMKWVALGTIVFVLAMFSRPLSGLVLGLPSTTGALIAGIGIAIWAACVAVAILRHRLFDIDVIIRKTLQWTLVTLLLGAVYVACVLGLQEAFKRLTGQTSEVAVALSTLALAVAFMPIRRAVQNLIDKRFYRKRYNAAQVIEAYAASIKDEVDVNVIHQKMLDVLGDTLQPKKIVLFLAQRDDRPSRRS